MDLTKELRAEIERLRAGGCARDQTTTQYCAEAARLAAENERLRKALHPFSEAAGKFDPDEGDGKQHVWGWSPTIEMLRKARAALQDKRDDPGEGKAASEGAESRK